MTAPESPTGDEPGKKNPGEKNPGEKKKYPAGTVVIWIAGAGIGLWFLISGLIGILSGGS
ncbi:hypothetical protein NS220_07945 [Microbacterium testaceum]|uniref:Uncharacterized protein n=1 Tax=Microbacterium testaceum TaxID=2033 RepID=A0A147EYF9_MICTE|nr:hypothetical protein [Microbacterium testaceum]KTR94775.1 hypothetical protein NS220_07945 [Microbacterium testaceum]